MNNEEVKALVQTYLDGIAAKYKTGSAREHAYRPLFENLIKGLDSTIQPLNDPARSQHGNPDFVFLRKDIILGYAETKDVGVDLDKTEKTNQMDRYRGYANLILTDYLEFRFYKNGEKYHDVCLGKAKSEGNIEFYPEQIAQFMKELGAFFELPPERVKSGKRLAEIMGGKAQRIRHNVAAYLASKEERNEELEKIYTMMKGLLVHDLTEEKFADMYAQTLVYGLFVARYSDETPENFSRKEARDLVPASNPFLREFFDHIVGPRFDARLGYIVDELCEVFKVSDVKEIVHKHLKVTDDAQDEKDPIIHFYEDFLKEYDPIERKKMGAYYTPIPVVRFIIRSVDKILKEEFGLAKGLADTSKKKVEVWQQGVKKTIEMHKVQILDPAVGTATFLNEIIKFIYQGFKGQEGRWPSYAAADLVPRLHGFELMMAPYTIAHLKLGMTLQETGLKHLDGRLGVYLTNTLTEGVTTKTDLFNFGLAETVSNEAKEAAKIKTERPIMVVIGNPPYSVSSNNKGEYIQNLIADYKKDLNEKKINLDDDYIKFIRFAESLIEKNGEGIVGMITNNSFIDGVTHRQMRKHLLETFDKIYVLDLHGNSKKKEKAKDGSKDENVFDIQQGVSIILGIKTGKKTSKEYGVLYHFDTFGLRKTKFALLEQKEMSWSLIDPVEPYFFFAPKNFDGHKAYEQGTSVDDLFIDGSSGLETTRDDLVVGFSEGELSEVIKLAKVDPQKLLTISERVQLKDVEPVSKAIIGGEYSVENLAYRPFDTRKVLYSEKNGGTMWRSRGKLMKQMIKGNLGIAFSRTVYGAYDWQDVQVLDALVEKGFMAMRISNAAKLYPLYLYSDTGDEKIPNFNPDQIKLLTAHLRKDWTPENILDYIYAVLHSPAYREKYKEFLKIDFPRVPAPKDDKEFQELAALGLQLRELHLLKSPKVQNYITTFPKEGSDEVVKVEYKEGKVFINPDQYFGDVPEVAWSFYIGGYQPAQKWLKDRKGRKLTSDDIDHYQQMIVALTETDRLMKEIDEVWKA